MATTGNTNKSISQYLHLYTGCQMSTPYGECKFLYYRSDVSPKQYNQVVVDRGDNNFAFKLDEVKPILRKLSSMTEEEHEAYETFYMSLEYEREEDHHSICEVEIAAQTTHWLLSKGFDLFGLLEAGLAIEKDSGLALDKENK